MKFWSTCRVYSCALVFALAAALWVAGVRGAAPTAFFLILAAASFVAAERERARQRRLLREELQRGHRS